MLGKFYFFFALTWLLEKYETFNFFKERDIEWTLQTKLLSLIKNENILHKINCDYKLSPDENVRPDIVFLNPSGECLLAVELKYEPSHKRPDISATKLPVTFWHEILKDFEKCQRYVETNQTKTAISVLIDEGNFYGNKVFPEGVEKIHFGKNHETLKDLTLYIYKTTA